MPETSPSSSTELNRPCAVRHSRIRWASTGPMPGRASSASTVAVLRSTGPLGTVAGAGWPGGSGGAGGGDRAGGPPRRRTTSCSPSTSRRARLTLAGRASGGGAAGRRDRVADPGPDGQLRPDRDGGRHPPRAPRTSAVAAAEVARRHRARMPVAVPSPDTVSAPHEVRRRPRRTHRARPRRGPGPPDQDERPRARPTGQPRPPGPPAARRAGAHRTPAGSAGADPRSAAAPRRGRPRRGDRSDLAGGMRPSRASSRRHRGDRRDRPSRPAVPRESSEELHPARR